MIRKDFLSFLFGVYGFIAAVPARKMSAIWRIETHTPVWQFGSTPLHKASEHGHEATVQLLIDKGADVNATNNVRAICLLWRERWPSLARS
jgi:hypothetical protein